MPTPTVIDHYDAHLKPPENWDEAKNGHCGALPIRREEVDGVSFMHSAWEVETTEILRLLSGGKLVLGVAGDQHPVVRMFVDAVPADLQPAYTVRRFTSAGNVEMVRVETLVIHHGEARRVWCEQPLTDGGLSVTVGRAIDLIDDLCRQNGWKL